MKNSHLSSTLTNELSEKLLLAVKMQQETISIVSDLEKLSLDELQGHLTNDQNKKAFWINIYNAFFQFLRKEHQLEKPAVFREQRILIAGHKFSLDDVEHGILRRYRYKFSLGYLPNIFTAALIKKLAVNKIDYRIHFALNCGAKSCPPIAFYKVEQLEQQLDMATLSFLESETRIYPQQKEVHTSRLFQWFIGDFGGKSGVRKILSENLHQDLKGYKLVYTEYSWEEALNNYA